MQGFDVVCPVCGRRMRFETPPGLTSAQVAGMAERFNGEPCGKTGPRPVINGRVEKPPARCPGVLYAELRD